MKKANKRDLMIELLRMFDNRYTAMQIVNGVEQFIDSRYTINNKGVTPKQNNNGRR